MIERRRIPNASQYAIGSDRSIWSDVSGSWKKLKIPGSGAIGFYRNGVRINIYVNTMWRRLFPELLSPLPPSKPGVRYKLVPGRENYAAGTDGSIWSMICGEWKKRRPAKNPISGYLAVSLQSPPEMRYVHDLVLETFVGPRPPGMVCRHFPDRDRSNNRLNNIQWGTRNENSADMYVHGTQSYKRAVGEDQPMHKLTEMQVRTAFNDITSGRRSAIDIANKLCVNKSTIYRILNGKAWRHLGLVS
jgi:hypothetical protein